MRGGSSGALLEPAAPIGLAAWNAAAPLTLTLLPAGHRAGVYSFSIALAALVAGSAGTVAIDATWDQPGVGSFTANYSGGAAINAVPGGFLAPRQIMSSGLAPIRVTLTPAAVAGSPIVYVNFAVDFIYALLPAGFP